MSELEYSLPSKILRSDIRKLTLVNSISKTEEILSILRIRMHCTLLRRKFIEKASFKLKLFYVDCMISTSICKNFISAHFLYKFISNYHKYNEMSFNLLKESIYIYIYIVEFVVEFLQ